MSAEPAQLKQENLERCLQLLEGDTTDEEKFAGLLLVTKLVDPQDMTSLHKVFGRISFAFLRRLLATKSSGPDLPARLLHQVAVGVLLAFVGGEDMAGHEHTLSTIPLLQALLTSAATSSGAPPEAGDSFQQDILRIFYAVSQSPQGVQQLILSGSLESFPVILRNQPAIPEDDLLLILLTTQNLFTDRHLMIRHHQAVIAIIAAVAPLFKANQQQLKFKILDFLVASLSFLLQLRDLGNEGQVAADLEAASKRETWVQDIGHGLRDILMSKIGNAQREPALLAVFLMMSHFGAPWLFVADPTSQDQSKSRKFVSVAVNVVCVEARILLEDQELSSVTLESGQKLAVYFEILEMVIHHLSVVVEAKGSLNTSIESDLLVQLKDAFHITFGALIDFLLPINDQVVLGNHTAVVNNPIVHACVRILSIWLTEEDRHLEGATTLLPLFVAVCRHSENSRELFTLLTPAFLQLTLGDESRDLFIEKGGLLLVADTVCNILGQDDVAKTATEGTKLQIPLELLLNVLMTSPGAAKKEAPTFLRLATLLLDLALHLGTAITNAASTPLSLHGSAVLLSLAIIRDLQSMFSSSDINSSKALQAAHYFLKAGLACKLSRSAEALEAWPGISELWFLCLKVLSDCLPFLAPSKDDLSSLGSLFEALPPTAFSSSDMEYIELLKGSVEKMSK